jgi:hypothetical protein
MGEFWNLVGLDVRAKAKPVMVKIGLTAPEVVLHHVQIDHGARGIQVLHKQLSYSFEAAGTPTRILSGTGRGQTRAA